MCNTNQIGYKNLFEKRQMFTWKFWKNRFYSIPAAKLQPFCTQKPSIFTERHTTQPVSFSFLTVFIMHIRHTVLWYSYGVISKRSCSIYAGWPSGRRAAWWSVTEHKQQWVAIITESGWIIHVLPVSVCLCCNSRTANLPTPTTIECIPTLLFLDAERLPSQENTSTFP